MSGLTIDDILNSLTKQAGEESESEAEKKVEEEGKKKEESQEVKENLSDAEGHLEEALKKEEDVEKKAADLGRAIAQDFLTKLAGEVVTSTPKQTQEVSKESVEMNDQIEKAAAVQALVAEGIEFSDAVDLVKQAEFELAVEAFEQEKQAALSDLVYQGYDFESAAALVKQAADEAVAAGEVPGIGIAGVPNKVQQQIIEDEAQSAALVQPLPSEGTATDILNAIVQKATAEGNVPTDNAAQAPFVEQQTNEVVKAAAVGELVGQGYSLDEAVNLVKQAGTGMVPYQGNGRAPQVAGELKKHPMLGAKLKALATSKGAKIAGGAAAVGAAAYGVKKLLASGQEKQAAVSALVQEGLNFEDAVAAVQSVTL